MAHVALGSCEEDVSKEFYSFEKLNKYKTNTLIYHRINQNEEKQFSFADVIAEARKFVILLNSNGVGERLGIALHFKEHTPALCAALIGILNRNCFFCPVANSESSKVAQQMRRLDASFLLADKTFLNVASFSSVFEWDIFGESLVLYRPSWAEHNHVDRQIFPKKICYCIATSGSTGSPKAVYVPYSCIEPNVEALSNLLAVTAQDVVLLYAPITFDPFVIELFLALYNGAALIMTANAIRLNPIELLALMFPSSPELCGATILQITSSLFRLIIASSNRDGVPSIFGKNSLRALLLGGENFPSLKEWSKWLPKGSLLNEKRIFNIYGITEVSCWSTIHELKKDDQRIPLGHALENDTKLRIIDAQGVEICGQGIGELQIGSATRKCYLTREEAESEAIYKPKVQYRGTGDLVERDEKSQLYYIGRLKNTIKRFGVQICLDLITANIEKILCDPSVGVTCAFDDRNKELTVFIALQQKNSMQEQLCRISIMEKLDSHEKPDVIKFIDSFPLTSHGKKCTRQILLDHANAPKTPLEKFNRFLTGTLGIKYSADDHTSDLNTKEKRLKPDSDLSFIAAGGNSFHALNLATDIGLDLVNIKDKQQFLKMVFDDRVPLNDIALFLNTVSTASTYKEEYTLPTEPNPSDKPLRLQVAWRVNLKKCVDATPSAFDIDEFSFICIGSHSHLVLTLNGSTGNQIASLTLPDRIEGTVEFISNSMALVGCYDGHLYAFDFQTGQLLWDFNLGGMIKSKPIQFKNCVIVASYAEEFNLSCITLDRQTVKWKKRIGTKGILATPLLLKNSCLIICALDGKYGCVDAETGACIWEEHLKSPIFSNAATAFKETHIVIAEVSGTVNICNASNGAIVAQYDAGGNIFSGITLQHIDPTNAFITFGCHDHNVYCLKYSRDEKLIALHWKYNLSSPIYSTPKIFEIKLENGHVCTCSTKGVIVILELRTGYLVSKYDLGANVFSSPCVAKSKDKIYIGCRDNYVYCLSLK